MVNISQKDYCKLTPEIIELKEKCIRNSSIEKELYNKYKVNRGLRDLNGKGVLTGLTEISEIKAKDEVRGKSIPCNGKLYYRGIDIEDLVSGFIKEKRFGFEEVTYLLLLGELPSTCLLYTSRCV